MCLIFQIPVMAMSHMIIETASKVVCSWANKNNKSWWYFLIWVVLVGLEGKSPFVIVIVCWAPDPQFFQVFQVEKVELVSKELNHFGVIACLFRQIGGHSSRFVLFCSFWRLFTIKMIKSVKVFPFSFWKILNFFFLLYKNQTPGIDMQNGRQVI